MAGGSGGGAAKWSFLEAMPFLDMQGTTLVLGTAVGSITVPTNPRPHGMILYPELTTETFMRVRGNTPSGGADDGYLKNRQTVMAPLNNTLTTINARVAANDGTLYASWVFAGSVTGS